MIKNASEKRNDAVCILPFGKLNDGTEIRAYRLCAPSGASVTVLEYGATLQAFEVPDKNGRLTDIVLGYDTAAEYEAGNACMGATVGRVAGRIEGAAFTLQGQRFELAKNEGQNHLHGGIQSFDRQMWQVRPDGNSLVCTRRSPDGEEGYPGNLDLQVIYTLEENALQIRYEADTDRDTPLSLTNHSYWNLNGGGSVLRHYLRISAEKICELRGDLIPTGCLRSISGTPFDFRLEKEVGAEIDAADGQLQLASGYDHNYALEGNPAAVLYSAQSGIELTVCSDQPGLQLYTANFLETQNGKHGKSMGRRSAVCLETQQFPNAVNCPAFPSAILKAGMHYSSSTTYAFRIR